MLNVKEICSIEELSNVITEVVNFIVKTSCENTSSGNYIMGYDDVEHLINFDDYLRYFSLIENELISREEVLDLEIEDGQFNVMYGLNWCPNYELVPGDEELLGLKVDKDGNLLHVKEPELLLSLTEKANKFDVLCESMNGFLKELENACSSIVSEEKSINKIVENLRNRLKESGALENKNVPLERFSNPTNVKQISLDIAAPRNWDGEYWVTQLLENHGITVLGGEQTDFTDYYKNFYKELFDKDGMIKNPNQKPPVQTPKTEPHLGVIGYLGKNKKGVDEIIDEAHFLKNTFSEKEVQKKALSDLQK